jgi:hypothetical protein
MSERKNNINRRAFLRSAGATGIASVFASAKGLASQQDPNTPAAEPNAPAGKPEILQVPKRPLGKTGVKVPILTLGGIFDIENNQVVLQKAIEWGVTYLDTAHGYTGGKSEVGIGKYLKKYPEMREKLFIVTKASGANDVSGMEQRLQTSLQRLNTSYVDSYFIHGLGDPGLLTEEVRSWVEDAKKRKLIRFFGFSTHGNMAKCMAGAAKLGWVDVIMTKYDFRLMQEPEISAAVQVCYDKGVGLVAMKAQAASPIKPDAEEDQKLAGHFLKQGYSEHQAKMKMVWQDKRIASICSQMATVAVLGANVAAALDKTSLTRNDVEVLRRYAQATCGSYCAGCAEICSRAMPEGQYISEVMRYLMYSRYYGDEQRARELFAQIPREARKTLCAIDYSRAESLCPQHLPIGKLMAEAASELA